MLVLLLYMLLSHVVLDIAAQFAVASSWEGVKCLNRVLRSAARLTSGIAKFGYVSALVICTSANLVHDLCFYLAMLIRQGAAAPLRLLVIVSSSALRCMVNCWFHLCAPLLGSVVLSLLSRAY